MTIAPTPATADVNDSPSTSKVPTGWLAVLGRTVPNGQADRPNRVGAWLRPVSCRKGHSLLGGRTTRAERSSTAWLSAALPWDRFHGLRQNLANRIRELIGSESDLTKKMFGGLTFLIGGNLAVAASGQGGILVRVDPAQSDALVATTKAHHMEMRGRRMQGWLRVDPEDVRSKRQLVKCVDLGTTYARSLPAKR